MSDNLPARATDAPVRAAGGLVVRDMDDIARMAKVAADSGMFRDGREPLTPQRAGVKMLFALAMGFEPITGLTGVDLIEGNPAPNGHFWAAALESHPRYDYEVVESSDERCVIRFFRDGVRRGEVAWTMEDARRAGLAGKDNWKRYPRAMLYNRAMTEGGRMYCPQLFGGVRAYVPEELRPDEAAVVPAVSGGGDGGVDAVAALPPPQVVEAPDAVPAVTAPGLVGGGTGGGAYDAAGGAEGGPHASGDGGEAGVSDATEAPATPDSWAERLVDVTPKRKRGDS